MCKMFTVTEVISWNRYQGQMDKVNFVIIMWLFTGASTRVVHLGIVLDITV